METNLPPEPNIPPPPGNPVKLYLLILLLFLLLIAGFFFYKFKIPWKVNKTTPSSSGENISLNKFSSFEEFKAYMQSAVLSPGGNFGAEEMAVSDKSLGAAPAGRVSETNIQVKGIDEADIVKTDGRDIYISGLGHSIITRAKPLLESVPPYRSTSKTSVIEAFPLDRLAKKTEIEVGGELYLSDNILLVLEPDNLIAYNVSDSSQPKEIYRQEFDTRNQIISSRLYGQELYLALRISGTFDNCLLPLITGDSPFSLSCTDIYRPDISAPADSVYTVLKLDFKSGRVEARNSFVGTMTNSVLYMSKNNLYLTYVFAEDYLDLFYSFYLAEGKDLITGDVLSKLKNLRDLDLSTQAKYLELSVILENYKQSLGEDELLRIENETQNRLSVYLKKNIRSIEKTGLVKLSLADLSISATGSVPGKPLNQFSLDEYDNVLRIAQTVGGGMVNDYSANDVYLLDNNLKEIGKITDLGIDERIYSVRFIGTQAYLVTFKETDPFYVLDLSDPRNPKVAGELKIPGYSAYLHPLEKNLILGIGKEGQNVKLSFFDVSDPSSPREIDKYNLDEYWSEILSTHKAFLQDEKYQLFFVPGSKGGYLFFYRDNSLKLLKAISQTAVQRAIFINDYLYLISESKITVLDEKTGDTLKTLSF